MHVGHDLPDEITDLARRAIKGDVDAQLRISELVCAMFNGGRYGALLGVVAELATPQLVKGHLPYRQSLTRGGEIFHGGAVMSLLDHLSGLFHTCDPRNILAGRTGVTTDFNITFLRAVPPGEDLRAELHPLRAGRNMVYIQGDAYGSVSNSHVARARITALLLNQADVGLEP